MCTFRRFPLPRRISLSSLPPACLARPRLPFAGLLFGLGSLYKASATYVMPADAVFSPFRSDFPIGSILLSVGTRVLFGFLLGCLFQLTRKSKRKNLCKLLITIAAPKLHALLVYTAMGLFFPSLGLIFHQSLCLKKRPHHPAVLCCGRSGD